MRSFGCSFLLAVLITFSAQAHVRIQPTESQQGASQTYTVRVPTEGQVATTWIELEVPTGVSITRIEGQAETKKIGDRIASIVWRLEIPPGQSREFVFIAVNPTNVPELSWRAHQHYADGSSTDWVEGPSNRRPASITKLIRGRAPE